jgi:predicted O-linked N-acetylglucosamine transferase (SPINDLY family)
MQPLSSPSSTVVAESSSSGRIHERTRSITPSPARSQIPPSHYQSSIDLMASSLKCDDCQTNDGLFQCCHCNQRLCIRCCNKHYKKVTVELERLHELSDRLVAKIVHTKNDLERQKNETLEQCHKWRVDTINTINKAHSLIVQTIHNEYETLGKEYELFVQKEMAHIHVDQNELMRMKKGNLGSLLSSTSSTSTTDSTNSIDTIRKRIETFAKNIDETGKFLFQVKLPIFDIDDSLRVESRFGDVTRSTSATWQNGCDTTSSSPTDIPIQEDKSSNNVQSSETDIPLSNNNNDVIINTNDEIEELPDKINEQVGQKERNKKKAIWIC